MATPSPDGSSAVAREQEITPWKVEGAVNESGEVMGIDYTRLIEQFGTRPIEKALLQRFELATGVKPHRLLRRDDEKFLFKPTLQLEECHSMALENAKDIIACGFDPKLTFIFSNLDYVGGAFYANIVRIAKSVTGSSSKSTFGFSDSDNIGMQHFVAIQAAPSFSNTFPHIFGVTGDIPALIPCAIDQDPYFRITRDVAPRLQYPKPSLIHARFLPSLQGAFGKMSSSESQSTVLLSDTEKQVYAKINKYAFSGGKETVEEHRKLGGDPDVDVSFQYLRYFLEDDTELEKIRVSYKYGDMLSGELKALCARVVSKVVSEFQARRSSVGKDDVRAFMDCAKTMEWRTAFSERLEAKGKKTNDAVVGW
ncbi:hypothetical protein HDU93_006796 [Gonapodya sp. JEL0774]|nr:hypothetical protein HDU93_006796 [Gonapodya sp. JEL0774]